jgi:hypothetical protein
MSQMNKLFFAFAMLLIPLIAAAEESVARSYELPDGASLRLTVPPSWQEEIRRGPDGTIAVIVFKPASGNLFQVLVTPILPPNPDVPMPTPEQIKANVEWAAENTKEQAVEDALTIKELKGNEVIGYYFAATDKAPKPDEYEYLNQGMLRVGRLVATFTVLTNNGGERVGAESLNMLSNASYVKTKPAEK